MKKAVLMSFVILLLSVAMVFAQTEQEAVASTEDDVRMENPIKAQKVSNIRNVVIGQNTQKPRAKEAVKYDEKGGIIVPNASEGIDIKPNTSQQKEVLNRVVNAQKDKLNEDASALEPNSSSAKQIQRSGQKQSINRAKDKPNK